jgi:hypothetical protein
MIKAHVVCRLVTELGREDVQFVIVGGVTKLEAFKAMATELGGEPYVPFTAQVLDQTLL